jgi:LmbE family N-acetylglucosaminyl deacetylase
MAERIVVIAAHPDDEVLGCGATMAWHVARGDRVDVLIVAEGVTSRDSRRDELSRAEALRQLRETARSANDVLGTSNLEFGGYPDNRLDSVDLLDIIKTVESFLARVSPAVIYTHCGSDLNVDHRIVSQAVSTASRPMPGVETRTLLNFEVASSTDWQTSGAFPPFVPNWFVDVSATLAKKVEALTVYSEEMRPWPHARSIKAIEHLARWRGATVGVDAAEAYVVGRHLVLGESRQ